MTSKITYKSLKASEIEELNSPKTLYTIDPRYILEEYNSQKQYLKSCENALIFVLKNQKCTINQFANTNNISKNNKFITIETDPDPSISIYKRISEKQILKNNLSEIPIKKIFTAIPHPDADALCKKYNLTNNYSVNDFLIFNNKISQKKAFNELTPSWEIITSKKELENKIETNNYQDGFFLKRSIGSGGYCTFHSSSIPTDITINEQNLWYIEKEIKGKSNSIQIYRDEHSNYTIFGYTEMRIFRKRNYGGAIIKKAESIPERIKPTLEKSILCLEKILSQTKYNKTYKGFLGIDFIDDGINLHILEANVRVTMATFASLRLNEMNRDKLKFFKI